MSPAAQLGGRRQRGRIGRRASTVSSLNRNPAIRSSYPPGAGRRGEPQTAGRRCDFSASTAAGTALEKCGFGQLRGSSVSAPQSAMLRPGVGAAAGRRVTADALRPRTRSGATRARRAGPSAIHLFSPEWERLNEPADTVSSATTIFACMKLCRLPIAHGSERLSPLGARPRFLRAAGSSTPRCSSPATA